MTLAILSLVLAGASVADITLAGGQTIVTGRFASAEADIDFFSGDVADVSSSSIEVVRSSLGRNDQRRFSINEETRFEGSARRGSRVTVGYYPSSPSVAVRVIVRDND